MHRIIIVLLFSISLFFNFFFVAAPSSVFAANCPSGGCVCYFYNKPEGECVGSCGGVGCTTKPCRSDIECSLGSVVNPLPQWGSFCKGLVPFINNILRLFFIIAGLIAFLNILLAGFMFMSAGGDPKAIQGAWGKIWQSFIGLLVLVAAFLISAIIGIVIFGNPTAILNPILTGAPGAVCPP